MQKTYDPQTAKFIATIAQNMPEISADVMQGWIENPKGLKKVLTSALCPPKTIRSGREQAEAVNTILRCLSGGKGITISACDGSDTLARANDVFEPVDPNFKNWGLDKPGPARSETAVDVYALVKTATFTQMFGSLGADLDKLCFSQHQIKTFCKEHAGWLRTDCATFFLFKVDGQFFVACVDAHRSGSGLSVYVFRFEDGGANTLYSRRVVAPQAK